MKTAKREESLEDRMRGKEREREQREWKKDKEQQ